MGQGSYDPTKRSMLPGVYDSIVTGEVTGVTTEAALPNVPAKLVEIKAQSGNTGNVYIGTTEVTVPNGVTDTTSGIALYPGQNKFFYVSNLNVLHMICDDITSHISYLVYN